MALLAYLALILAVIPYLALSAPKTVRALQQPGKRRKWMRDVERRKLHGLAYSAALLIPYLLAALPGAAADPLRFGRELALMALYLLAPMFLQQGRKSKARRPDVLDLVTIALLWLPVELGWLPDVQVLGVSVPMLLGAVNALLIYLVIAPWPVRKGYPRGIGYTFRLKSQEIGLALLAALIAGAAAVAIGLAGGALTLSPQNMTITAALLALVTGYLFTALPQELLFRGLIQQGMERLAPRSPAVTLIVPALLYGLAQFNDAPPADPIARWSTVAAATVVGLACGYVWRRTGKITASAITGALAAALWLLLSA